MFDESDKDELLYQLVYLITENRKKKIINFCECVEIKYLKFVQAQTKKLENNSETKIDFSLNCNTSQTLTSELINNQLNKTSRN